MTAPKSTRDGGMGGKMDLVIETVIIVLWIEGASCRFSHGSLPELRGE